MNTMKSTFKPIVLAMVFVVSMINSLQVYGQESSSSTTTNNITEQIKNQADEVANNSTGKTNQTEAKDILTQLGQAANKTALGGADVLSNLSGEIKEGLK
jgi:hypothetical protein